MTRIQLDVSDEKVAELEKLMSTVGLKTKKELLNNALTLLEWAVKERAAGRVIASVDEHGNKYKEILMPVLQNVTSGQTHTGPPKLTEVEVHQ